MLQERQYRREVAQKTSVAEILEGGFVETEDGSTVLNVKGRQIKRANILTTIVDKASAGGAYKSMVADDGTGQIRLRFFDSESQLYEKPEVGDFVLVIGRPRHYGEEKYIAPELVKPLRDVKWAEVRKLELKLAMKKHRAAAIKDEKNRNEGVKDAIGRDKVEVYKIIKELDTGRGADATEVVMKCEGGNADSLIKEMIRAGDLFEVSPGKLKVLE
ncbi:hypothetical protein HYU20_03345 [Candidatus Woesearchaeota archaeon]|nr:hypothetical protein [Candidatus Woesearchaeota archaeon]